MMRSKKIIVLTLIVFTLSVFSTALIGKKKEEGFIFKIDKQIKATPVKAQSRTGTCWCFSTISFLESEFLRENDDPELDLSEIYVVRQTYPYKADSYAKLHTNTTLGQGGQSHDVIDQIKKHGLVPEQVYNGMNIGKDYHDHSELFRVVKGFLDGLLTSSRRFELTPNWRSAFASILDAYLGTPPKEFKYKGKKYTPKSFAKDYIGLNWDDYIELTSYTAYPFYQTCRLELPDNWTFNQNYYNLPIDELEKLTDQALKDGYTLVWDGDVSEEFFTSRKFGIAIIPEDKNLKLADLKKPVKEQKITQEMREKTLLNFSTTDDHLMHIVGTAHDQNGTKYYLIKNSGGTTRANKGFIYMSKSYFRLKTTALMINQKALSSKLRGKLKI